MRLNVATATPYIVLQHAPHAVECRLAMRRSPHPTTIQTHSSSSQSQAARFHFIHPIDDALPPTLGHVLVNVDFCCTTGSACCWQLNTTCDAAPTTAPFECHRSVNCIIPPAAARHLDIWTTTTTYCSQNPRCTCRLEQTREPFPNHEPAVLS